MIKSLLDNVFGFEKKSAPVGKFPDYLSFVEFLGESNTWGQVSAAQAIRYYKKVAPLGTAIDMIADEIATIDPLVYNEEIDEFDYENEIYKLLSKPNPITNKDQFMKQMAVFYNLTANVYIVATGNIGKAPLEMYCISPQFVTIDTSLYDGLPEKYTVSQNAGREQIVYRRKETPKGMRFFDDTGSREMFHIKDFNPDESSDSPYGLSRLNSTYMELEQHYASSKHNLSLLKKGARLSGALVTDGILTDDQYRRVQQQIDRFYSGSDNAGRVMIGEGGLKFSEMSVNNKDMDFRQLKNDVANNIYTRMKIPLPLISPDHMTLANMDSARLNLYDMAVLPCCERLYISLTEFFKTRGILSDKQKLFYDADTISALRTRHAMEIKIKKETGVLTINELRQLEGYEPLSEGGDTLYQPQNLVPVSDTPAADPVKVLNQEKTKALPYNEFKKIMVQQIDQSGKRLFSDNDIAAIAKSQGIK